MPYELRITKMHGIGNSYVIVEDLKGELQREIGYGLLGRSLSDKSFGVGSDGILVANRGNAAPYWMRVINPDGSEAEMCGNGIRMFARYLFDSHIYRKDKMEVEAGGSSGGRIVKPSLNLERYRVTSVTVDMNEGKLEGHETLRLKSSDLAGKEFSGYIINVGNPHYVVFTPSRESAKESLSAGPYIENHSRFPKRTNVEFVHPANDAELFVFVWERGAGPTLACGTGACASAFAAHKNGIIKENVKVHLPGGDLDIGVLPDDRIMMTGPAEYIFQGGKIPDLERFLSVYQDFERRGG
ncbi:MAG: diaminopimelate epimerase [Candidatus Aenigmarchaeota archaeon]|nr:diaminopimelate epimerase [Candidatus Aenigmarchaeota archaeon]